MNIVYISTVSLSLDINTQQMSFKSVYIVVVVVVASLVSFCLSYDEVLIVLYQSGKKRRKHYYIDQVDVIFRLRHIFFFICLHRDDFQSLPSRKEKTIFFGKKLIFIIIKVQ